MAPSRFDQVRVEMDRLFASGLAVIFFMALAGMIARGDLKTFWVLALLFAIGLAACLLYLAASISKAKVKTRNERHR